VERIYGNRFSFSLLKLSAALHVTGVVIWYEKGLYRIMPSLEGLWLDLMVGVCMVYALLIFGLEKALFRRIFRNIKQMVAEKIFFP
jgi:hypothetical protein